MKGTGSIISTSRSNGNNNNNCSSSSGSSNDNGSTSSGLCGKIFRRYYWEMSCLSKRKNAYMYTGTEQNALNTEITKAISVDRQATSFGEM